MNSVAESPYDYLFTANTLHIMSWQSVENLFCWLPKILKPGGLLFTYGPFKFEGCFTSESNKSFDVYLKKNNPEQGIRDIEALEKLACKMDIGLLNRHDLPANNHLLVWRFNPAA